MAVTAKRLHGPAQVSNVVATKYTAGATTRTTVRHIHISNPSGAAVTFTMSIGADAAGVRIFDAFSVPANTDATTKGVIDHYCYYVLAPGELIQALAGTNNILVLTIDGEEDTV